MRISNPNFVKKSGIEFPETINLANFMGYHERIHKEMYRNPLIIKDIIEVSQLLEATQGVRDATNNLIEETDSEAEHDSSEITENNETFQEISYSQQSNDSSLFFPAYKKRTTIEMKAVRKKRRSGSKDLISVYSVNAFKQNLSKCF
ncbi:uncharacterized protein LOC105426424 isoform X1 [Pogonomyrmex barbatus]|uniref:Uncharacterized protein LOC105426424 isoform X1 n=2 Tax=Pogonomyrmex barbatus TaxID=144034 RepID=A0A6I9WVK9_9HYME|nr:uncharacterized protein LOC105426424 isoform X1 [Pogonomyrmex barbatus]